MLRLTCFILLVISVHAYGQGWRDPIPHVPGHVLEFETKEFTDTIWLYRDSMVRRYNGRNRYNFKFKVINGENVHFAQSRRIGGADPDYNCGYPSQPLNRGDSGKISICFPGRILGPPYVLTRRYLLNSSAETQDTLVINRVFRWADRDTLHETYKLGDIRIRKVKHQENMDGRIIYCNVHEDEQTSLDVLREFSYQEPINYWYLTHDSTRRITFNVKDEMYTIDPNRIYTDSGIVHTLKDGGNYSEDAFEAVHYFSRLLKYSIVNRRAKMVVTLHNNTPDNYSILSYLDGGDEAQNARSVYVNPDMDPDNFIYTTDEWVFDQLKEKNVNVILQNNYNPVDDGSMSVYCAREDVPYINIEAEHGQFEAQMELLRLIYRLLEFRYP